jgi:long-chain acyl-CoA synthetase
MTIIAPINTIPDALHSAATHVPERLAYIEGRRRVNWADVHRAASEAAAGLVSLGLAKGERVAICAENSIDWIVAFHAILRAGGAAVPVYYELRQREIEEQVKRPACRFLFATNEVLAKLPGGIGGVEHVILLGAQDTDAPIAATMAFDALVAKATIASRTEVEGRAPKADDLAVIVYTSGTTGGAKGVMLSHRNLISNAFAAIQALELNSRDSSLLVLPLHHAMPLIAAVILLPIIGAHFVIENDLRRIRDRLQEHRPTIFFGVPALYEVVYRNILARAEAEGRLRTLQRLQKWLGAIKRITGVNLAPLAFRSISKALGGRLRFLVSGGAALSPQTQRDFASLGLPLLQGWGMTEASPVVAVQRWHKRRFQLTNYYEKHTGSVGPALPGVEVRLVDVAEKGIRVTEGGEGEVLVRGPNVFMGYWDAPVETEAALDNGWLRTGDLGRIDREGNIYLTGRSKYIIVLESGEKVHPDELENVLAQSPLVADVCVTGRPADDGRNRTLVTAIVYPNPEAARDRLGASLDEPALRKLVQEDIDQLGRQLAAYKRVTRIELSTEPLPKTALQKVARGRVEASYEFDFEVWEQPKA